jgi:initiation factor 1A
MPNKKGGKKYKQGKASSSIAVEKELILADDEQTYGLILKCYGNGRFQVLCNDNVERLGVLRGSLRKRGVWVTTNSLVLVSRRDFEQQKDKVDIIHGYQNYGDVRSLIDMQELSSQLQNAMAGMLTTFEENNMEAVDFVDDDGDGDINIALI